MSQVVVADADVLISLFYEKDMHSSRTFLLLEKMYHAHYDIIYPATAIAEAITTFQRKLSKPKLSKEIVDRIKNSQLKIENVDQSIIENAAAIFDPEGSKQNTFFDAIVAAVARKYAIEIVFSFDAWYKKLGFKLATELFNHH